ncbi:MAG: hypothetical protein IT450_01620 [Phycisphaerales bacterium]|nr:hypothetical protein [Phycisphaerales bacterium]
MTLHAGWTTAIALGFGGLLVGGCPQTAATSASEDASISASENTAPTAAAGADITAAGDQLVVLDGSGSTDADGDRLAFIWRQVSGSPTVVLQDGFSSRPRFYAPADTTATLRFRLTVVDGLTTATDEVDVTITP